MPEQIDEADLDRAPHVCRSCRNRKRRCDKALPKCSACSKRNVPCEYFRSESQIQSVSASPNDQLWYSSSIVDGSELQRVDFPTILFLDQEILQHGQIEVFRGPKLVPNHILDFLGDMNEMHLTASRFFDHVHSWMPFISKKRFYDLYLLQVPRSQPDVALLLISLKLITTLPPTNPRNPRTPLYHAVKHFYLEVESSDAFSILVLQAGVLVALYELGHGIYPAAFMSIGACARYANALGINVSPTVGTKKILTLVEAEERRRVWWAIVILDKFVNIGCPGRPFVTECPQLNEILPSNDRDWDQGIVNPGDSFTLSSPMTAHMTRFALLCQAARLLGQVLEYIIDESVAQDEVWLQLDRTLQSMLIASLNVDNPDSDQIAFIYSTMVALHNRWLHSPNATEFEHERAKYAKFIVKQILGKINKNLVEKQCFVGRDPDEMSPWGLFFAYRICVILTRYPQDFPQFKHVIHDLEESFRVIDIRWNAAGAYLQLLEAQKVMGI